jgi:hypothetical protein
VPVTSLIHVAARRATPGATFGAGPTRPTAKALLDTIGIYIPTDVSTLYIPVAAGMVAANESASTKRLVAIGVALLAAFATWVLAHKTARKAADDAHQARPSALTTLKAGWYEVAAAAVAFFIWAWAMPGSWHDFGKSQWFLPALVVAAASIAIGGIATLANRDQGG